MKKLIEIILVITLALVVGACFGGCRAMNSLIFHPLHVLHEQHEYNEQHHTSTNQ